MLSCMLTACDHNWVSNLPFAPKASADGKDFHIKSPLWGINCETFSRRRQDYRFLEADHRLPQMSIRNSNF
jgi:hypothetical protein